MTWATLIVIIIATIAPGIMIFFLFNKELFIQLDVFKISLLSIAITMPIWGINSSIIYAILESEGETEEEILQFCAILGGILSILPLYAPILTKVFIDISSKSGVLIALIIEIILIVLISLFYNRNKKKST